MSPDVFLCRTGRSKICRTVIRNFQVADHCCSNMSVVNQFDLPSCLVVFLKQAFSRGKSICRSEFRPLCPSHWWVLVGCPFEDSEEKPVKSQIKRLNLQKTQGIDPQIGEALWKGIV